MKISFRNRQLQQQHQRTDNSFSHSNCIEMWDPTDRRRRRRLILKERECFFRAHRGRTRHSNTIGKPGTVSKISRLELEASFVGSQCFWICRNLGTRFTLGNVVQEKMVVFYTALSKRGKYSHRLVVTLIKTCQNERTRTSTFKLFDGLVGQLAHVWRIMRCNGELLSTAVEQYPIKFIAHIHLEPIASIIETGPSPFNRDREQNCRTVRHFSIVRETLQSKRRPFVYPFSPCQERNWQSSTHPHSQGTLVIVVV